jgi:hypothetical protein
MEAHRVVRLLWLPHFLDNRQTDGGEVVSLTRRLAAVYPHEDSWYSFLLEAESTAGPHSATGRIRSIEKSNYLIRNRIRYLLALCLNHLRYRACT